MSHQWMPFYVGDYTRDTMHLSALEHGIYILLILHYWEHGFLPAGTARKAAISRVSPRAFARHETVIKSFFSGTDWRHKRIDEELAKLENIKARRKIAGHRGGVTRAINRYRSAKQLLGEKPAKTVSKWVDNHKVSKKEAAEKESVKRPDQISKAELDELFEAKRNVHGNGRAPGRALGNKTE